MDQVNARAAFDALLAEFGRAVGMDGIKSSEDGTCFLSFEPDLELAMLANPVNGNLVLWTSLGTLAAAGGDRAAGYRRLLEGNLFWRDTDGGTLALVPDTEEVVLAYQQPLAGLDAAGLRDLIERAVTRAERLKDRRQMAADATAPPPRPPETTDVGLQPFAIRG